MKQVKGEERGEEVVMTARVNSLLREFRGKGKLRDRMIIGKRRRAK